MFAAVAVACSAVLVLGACGSSGSDTASAQDTAAAGDPVAGGSATVLQAGEPRSLDPAALSNTWAHQRCWATLSTAS